MTKRYKKIIDRIAEAWRPIVSYGASVIALGVFFGWRLLSIPGGYAEVEAEHAASTLKFVDLLSNPVSAPVTALQYLLNKMPFIDAELAVRGGSVIIAVVAVLGFFLLVRKWLDKRVALFAAVLFATCSTTLIMARLGTADSGFLLVPLFLLIGLHLKNVRSGSFSVLIAVFFAGLLYIPGFFWLLLAATIWQRKQLRKAMKRLLLHSKLLASIAGALFLAPLVFAISKDPSTGLVLLGLPDSVPSIAAVGENFAKLWSNFFVVGQGAPVYGLGRLPVLDVATIVLFILGATYYVQRWRLDRVRIVVVCTVILTVLASLGGSVSPLAAIGLIYIVAASGILYLLDQWARVFPLNPVAGVFATIIISAFISLISVYHTTRYFIAWAKSPETVEAFDRQNLLQ